MNKLVFQITILVTLLFSANNASSSLLVHHKLNIQITPKDHTISVVDSLDFSANKNTKKKYIFILHKNMDVKAIKGKLHLLPDQQNNYPVPVNTYSITLDEGEHKAIIQYSGKIYHPAKEEHGRSVEETPGLIGNEGIYLSQTSAWYPLISQSYQTFEMHVSTPSPWKIVSQGERINNSSDSNNNRVSWKELGPQQGIYLIGGKFFEYEKFTGSVDAIAFLREQDAALAQRYLSVTAQYIEMYRQLIGPYPYTKFALVENFWETGYGMPSFTLLGPRVIRLPFILHSSYPHEILHNWWGNSVYVDHSKGNWAEGLTAYLADHLIKEQRNAGPAFRRNILQDYADFVGESKDFALNAFSSRHSASSQAIGYGKTQMLFNMLRLKIGDENFIHGLKALYKNFKYREASFDDIQQIYSEITETNLAPFFKQWVNRVGAPKIILGNLMRKKDDKGWKLTGRIKQIQKGEYYELDVPVAITLAGNQAAYQTTIIMKEKEQHVELYLFAEPIRIDVDPEFDVFRRLDRSEIPPALSQALGDDRALMILPSNASTDLIQAYQQMIKTWQQTQAVKITSLFDNELTELPDDQSVWVLGRKNKFAPDITSNLSNYGFALTTDGISIDSKPYTYKNNSIVLSSRSNKAEKHGRILVTTDNPKAIAGLARKLPHYRNYSFLIFEGNAPTNIGKGQWIISNSPMSFAFTDAGNSAGKLATRAPLAQPLTNR